MRHHWSPLKISTSDFSGMTAIRITCEMDHSFFTCSSQDLNNFYIMHSKDAKILSLFLSDPSKVAQDVSVILMCYLCSHSLCLKLRLTPPNFIHSEAELFKGD